MTIKKKVKTEGEGEKNPTKQRNQKNPKNTNKKTPKNFPYSEWRHAQVAIGLSPLVDHQDKSELKTFRPLALNFPDTAPTHKSLSGHHPQYPNSYCEQPSSSHP